MGNKHNSSIKQLINKFDSLLFPTIPSSSDPLQNTVVAKADSGASRHYFRQCDKHVLTDSRPTFGPSVFLPNI